ncbi:MAG TPA: hypothetical protein ENH41_02335 [Candidatus Omnitrophica bacterium]|nr:hypothetical protein [Candidatus Omnitrophota bacterium]
MYRESKGFTPLEIPKHTFGLPQAIEGKMRFSPNIKVNLHPPKKHGGLSLTGFTLMEIMIVVAIVMLLLSLAIPDFLRARVNAKESAAISNLRLVSEAAQNYRAANPGYPSSLASFTIPASDPPYLDDTFNADTVSKNGYQLILAGNVIGFTATAYPEAWGLSGAKSFFVDTNGTIRYSDVSGDVASAASSVLE